MHVGQNAEMRKKSQNGIISLLYGKDAKKKKTGNIITVGSGGESDDESSNVTYYVKGSVVFWFLVCNQIVFLINCIFGAREVAKGIIQSTTCKGCNINQYLID